MMRRTKLTLFKWHGRLISARDPEDAANYIRGPECGLPCHASEITKADPPYKSSYDGEEEFELSQEEAELEWCDQRGFVPRG